MKRLLILFFLFSHSISFSQEDMEKPHRIIEGSKEIPIELNLLLSSVQSSKNYTDEDTEKLLLIILNIDSYARVLTKEDIFLIGKIEVYKNLLKTSERIKNAVIEQKNLQLIEAGIKKARDPFIIWFLGALKSDIENLLSSKQFNDYSLQRSANQSLSLDSKKMDKKIQLLYRWITKINPDSPDFESIIRQELNQPTLDALHGIEHSFYLMASSTNFQTFPGLNKISEQMKFFSLKKVEPNVKPPKKEKSVDDILAPVIGSDKAPTSPDLPEPSKENWLEEDNAPSNLKNLPKPSSETDWLEDF